MRGSRYRGRYEPGLCRLKVASHESLPLSDRSWILKPVIPLLTTLHSSSFVTLIWLFVYTNLVSHHQLATNQLKGDSKEKRNMARNCRKMGFHSQDLFGSFINTYETEILFIFYFCFFNCAPPGSAMLVHSLLMKSRKRKVGSLCQLCSWRNWHRLPDTKMAAFRAVLLRLYQQTEI